MPEAGPHNKEYSQHHPRAIVDRDKAEVVARATKDREEWLVEAGEQIDTMLDDHADVVNRPYQDGEMRPTYGRKIEDGLSMMREKRISTDLKAKEVGNLYDDTQEELARLKGK